MAPFYFSRPDLSPERYYFPGALEYRRRVNHENGHINQNVGTLSPSPPRHQVLFVEVNTLASLQK